MSCCSCLKLFSAIVFCFPASNMLFHWSIVTSVSRSVAQHPLTHDDASNGGTEVWHVLCQVKEGLVPLLKQIREKGAPPDTAVLQGTFDTKSQAELCNSIAKELGFDLEKGRLDVSVHPFTGGKAQQELFLRRERDFPFSG